MDVKGCFVFRNEGDGCLTSKYLEHRSPKPFTESATIKDGTGSSDPFEGEYETTWLEPTQRRGNLKIGKLSSGDMISNGRIFQNRIHRLNQLGSMKVEQCFLMAT
jgi:hypothetical protein